MEMVEKYLYAVGKKLPLKQKEDILKELRSIIMDNLDDITNGSEPTESQVTKVLLDMGSPAEVAKRYKTGPSWLIGPDYYDTYILIVKIVLAAVLGGIVISLIVAMLASSAAFPERLGVFAVQMLETIPGLFTAIGMVTVIFTIIERVSNKKPSELDFGDDEKWSPAKLEPVPKLEERVKPIESILGIVFSVIALVIFTAYRDKIGIYYTPEFSGNWELVKVFSDTAFDTYIPLWSIIWALSIALCVWLLVTKKYTFGTRVFDLFIKAFNVGILFFMASGPVLFAKKWMTGDLEGFEVIVNFFNNNHQTIFSILAILTLIGLIVDVVKLVYRKIKQG